jgi:DNA-binding MarR family transcriptional regulator
MPAQWRVMAALGRYAPLTASEVGQRIVMDKVAVSRAVAGLMKRGLVERSADLDDRRRASLYLTPKGRATHADIVPLALKYEAELYQALSAEERQTLNALCDACQAVEKPPLRPPCGPDSPWYNARLF